MNHIAWSVLVLAAVLLTIQGLRHRHQARTLRFQIERHGLRLRRWARVPFDRRRDPWECPECCTTVSGHWAKVGHQAWHDQQEGRQRQAEPWDSASSEWAADRDAGTPPLDTVMDGKDTEIEH